MLAGDVADAVRTIAGRYLHIYMECYFVGGAGNRLAVLLQIVQALKTLLFPQFDTNF